MLVAAHIGHRDQGDKSRSKFCTPNGRRSAHSPRARHIHRVLYNERLLRAVYMNFRYSMGHLSRSMLCHGRI